MALCREKIERLEIKWAKKSDKPWRKPSYSRKWLKRQMNKYIRIKGKKISEDDVGFKQGKKPQHGYEYQSQGNKVIFP